MGQANDGINWEDAILSALRGSDKNGTFSVKELRKVVLLSLQLDTSDKATKKNFKSAVQALEKDGTVSLNAEGIITLKKKRDKKKREKETKEGSSHKKAKVSKDDSRADENVTAEKEKEDSDDKQVDDDAFVKPQHSNDELSISKNKPCKGNPQGVTRLFLGNLPFAVDEASLADFFLPGIVTHIKWITDKETGKFYGSAFIEMDTALNAAQAVAKAGQLLMGRPVKINFAPALPGDSWPPVKKTVTGGSGGGQAGGTGIKAMSEKPEKCTKLFIGNLSYDIDDDAITKFFANVGAEVKAVRWIHHKDTGDFKGVGFVEFWNTDACEKGATLNGKNLLGRPIRIDWSD